MRPIKRKTFSSFDALCVAAVLVAAFVTHMATCQAMSREIIRLVLRVRHVSAEVADLATMRATVEKGEEHLERFTSELVTLHKRVPDDLDTDGFLKELVGTAEENNVLIVRVEPGEVSEQGSYRDVPVAVEAKARFKDAHSFISALRGMSRLTKIEEMNIRSDEEGSCRVSLILRIYAYKERTDEEREKERHSA